MGKRAPGGRIGLSDTSSEAEAVQIKLLRRATMTQRLALAVSLSETVTDLALRAIRQTMPGATEEEVRLKFGAVHYGEELANRVRCELERRRG